MDKYNKDIIAINDVGVKSPNYDAYGLFRALHSHNPPNYSHIVGLSSHFYVYAPLRSVQNEHPLDVLHLIFGVSQVQKPYRASTNSF